MDFIWFNSKWEIKPPGGQPREHLILSWGWEEGRSQPGVEWRGVLLDGRSETAVVIRGLCHARNVVRCIASSLSRNPFHERTTGHYQLSGLLLNALCLGLVFLTCYCIPGTLQRCRWGRRKGSASILPQQVVSAVILPVLPSCVKENIPWQLLLLCSRCHCRYCMENQAEFFSSWKDTIAAKKKGGEPWRAST